MSCRDWLTSIGINKKPPSDGAHYVNTTFRNNLPPTLDLILQLFYSAKSSFSIWIVENLPDYSKIREDMALDTSLPEILRIYAILYLPGDHFLRFVLAGSRDETLPIRWSAILGMTEDDPSCQEMALDSSQIDAIRCVAVKRLAPYSCIPAQIASDGSQPPIVRSIAIEILATDYSLAEDLSLDKSQPVSVRTSAINKLRFDHPFRYRVSVDESQPERVRLGALDGILNDYDITALPLNIGMIPVRDEDPSLQMGTWIIQRIHRHSPVLTKLLLGVNTHLQLRALRRYIKPSDHYTDHWQIRFVSFLD